MQTALQMVQPDVVPAHGRILFFDPDPQTRQCVSSLFSSNGFAVESVGTIAEVLEALAFHRPEVVVAEIFAGDLKGEAIINAIRQQNSDPAIIIYTSQEERRLGADRRLGPVFEFVQKSRGHHEILSHVRRAISYYREKEATAVCAQDSAARMRNKLEWLIWKEKSKNSERISAEKTLINNIKHSIAQGLGIGGITTLIDLISMAAKQDGDYVDIPHHMFHQLVQTGDVIREWFDSLESITKAFGACYDSKPLESEGLCRIVKSSIEEVEKLRKIKNQNIFCETPPSVAVLAEEKGLALCVRELLTNAFKYSPEGSSIHITSYRTGNSVSLVVLNDVEFSTGRNTGVPREMENAVFEPFFRIHNTYDERFRSEELGMGIGLTVVQNAVNQFGGSVYVYEITDHASGLVPRRRVAAELILRTSQEASIADRTVSMRSVTR